MKKLSKKNPYALSRCRMLELRYFCLQYSEWEAEEKAINLYLKERGKSAAEADPTGEAAILLSNLHYNMSLVKDALLLAGDIDDIIFEGVTRGRSYDVLEARRGGLPWARGEYYKLYRKFMFILSCKKQGL